MFKKKTNETSVPTAQKKTKKGGLKAFLKSRKAKRGGVAAAILAVFICIIVLVNVATGLLVERFPNLQFDMTASQSYGLQDDTVEYLSQLDKDITVYVLTSEKTFRGGLNAYQGAEHFTQAYTLLKKMAADSKLSLKFVDLAKNPTFTAKYPDIDWNSETASHLILLDSGDDYTVLSLEDCFTYDSEAISYGYYIYTATKIEQAIVTGVLDLTTAQKVGIDFITGSGESEDSYSGLKNLLKQNAYSVEDVNLTTSTLREESTVAVLYSPSVDLSEEAARKLSDWLDNDGDNGRTLIYIPIDLKVETPNIDALLKEYGMKVSDGISFCTSRDYYINDPYMFLADYAEDTTYTSTLKNAKVSPLVYYTRDVEITDGSKATALLTDNTSVGVIPFDTDTSEFESESDLAKFYKADGITPAAIGTKTNSDSISSNVAVFGSPYMFTERFLSTSSFNNANYIVNFCNTVTDRGDMGITINSASVDSGELGVTNASTIIAYGIVFIAVIPLIVLAIGLIVFIRRRHR